MVEVYNATTMVCCDVAICLEKLEEKKLSLWQRDYNAPPPIEWSSSITIYSNVLPKKIRWISSYDKLHFQQYFSSIDNISSQVSRKFFRSDEGFNLDPILTIRPLTAGGC